MAIGLVFNLWHPLFVTPPYIDFTWVVYVLLGLTWIPVWGICGWLKPAGRIRRPFLLAVIGVLVVAINVCSLSNLPAGFWGSPLECRVISSTPRRVQYECVADRMFMVDKYIVEGLPGLPVVWLVAHITVNL
jgi:hypothetical protein